MIPSDTRDAIAAAFWELARRKGVDQITVSDLAGACAFTRQAFYYHFQNLGLLAQYAVERYTQLLADQVAAQRGPREAIALAFAPAVEHPETVLHLIGSKKYPFPQLITDAIIAQTDRLLLERRITRDLGFDATEVTVRFYAGGFFCVLLGACRAALKGQRVDAGWMADQYIHLLRNDLLSKSKLA